MPDFAVLTTRPKRLLNLLRAPAVAADLPEGVLEKIRVCGGFTQMLATRPALAALGAGTDRSSVRTRRDVQEDARSTLCVSTFVFPRRRRSRR